MPRSDRVLLQLIDVILPPDEAKKVLNGHYTTALHTALSKKIRQLKPVDLPPGRQRKVSALPKWRGQRVIDHINDHIDDRILLSDLADIAGLSPMYFAAQFRVAFGCSPREYIIRRRLELATELLMDPGMPIVDIALSVGFQSQSHFTTTFGRAVGQTPSRWRQSHAQQGKACANAL